MADEFKILAGLVSHIDRPSGAICLLGTFLPKEGLNAGELFRLLNMRPLTWDDENAPAPLLIIDNVTVCKRSRPSELFNLGELENDQILQGVTPTDKRQKVEFLMEPEDP